SFTFFFALGYGARALGPLMRRPGAWRVLDTIIAAAMWSIAGGLILG
ncbi:MAG: amino acid transporter, partial [Alphaproteobacteria bacterium]